MLSAAFLTMCELATPHVIFRVKSKARVSRIHKKRHLVLLIWLVLCAVLESNKRKIRDLTSSIGERYCYAYRSVCSNINYPISEVPMKRFLLCVGLCVMFSANAQEPKQEQSVQGVDHVGLAVTDPNRAVAFDRKHNVGLHHLALRVSSEATLNALHDTFLQDKQVKIEFAPELAGNGPNKHMMVYEPSGNRIEFIYRAAAR